MTVRTDRWPGDTSWTLTGDDCRGSAVLLTAGNYTGQLTTYAEKVTLCEGGTYTFEISDSHGDGICCGGFYSLKLDGVEIQRGGDFSSGDVYEFFGTNAPTSAPTVTPTRSWSPAKRPGRRPTLSRGPTLSGTASIAPSTVPSTGARTRAVACRFDIFSARAAPVRVPVPGPSTRRRPLSLPIVPGSRGR